MLKNPWTSILILVAAVSTPFAVASAQSKSSGACTTIACWAEQNSLDHEVETMPVRESNSRKKPTATTRDASLDKVVESVSKECDTIACWAARNSLDHEVPSMPVKVAKSAPRRVETPSPRVAAVAPRSQSPARSQTSQQVRSEARDDDDDDSSTPSPNSKYAYSDDRRRTEADITCPSGQCRATQPSAKQDPIANLVQAAAVIQAVTDSREAMANGNKARGQAPACDNFTDDDELKGYGKKIAEILHRPDMEKLYAGTPDFHPLCPNFKNFDRLGMTAEKDGFFILLISGIVHKEASCNPSARLGKRSAANPDGAPYGVAMGLFQLDLNREQNYTPLTKVCKRGDSKSAERSLECGLAMLNERAIRGLPIFASHYWDVLNPSKQKAKDIQNAIRNYPYCKLSYNANTKVAKR